MSEIIPIRPRVAETFVCPCGSQWFAIFKRFSTEGRALETREVALCEDCGRKHHVTKRPTP